MGQRLRFWVIADDVTGALDTAAPFAAHGWATCVVPWPGPPPRAMAAALRQAARAHDVVVFDTASRHVPAREAAARVRAVVQAARRIDGADPRAFYKKIDSTLRGNVAAELGAFRAATGIDCLPLAPAFPAQGRTTRHGAVWVDGRPLGESPAARDALAPALAGDLAKLGAPGVLDVFDARTDADLRRIATRLAGSGRLGAVAGSGGLAGAFAARFGSPRRAATPRLAAAAPGVLVVSGSAHPGALAQARALVGAGAIGLIAPIGARAASRDCRATEALALAALAAGRPVILACPPLAPGTRVAVRRAAAAAGRLAALAGAIVTAGAVGAVFTVGGDTTAAMVAAMDWAPLAVDGVLVPGVAVVRLDPRRTGPAWLITKSGGFGDPQTLCRLVRRLTIVPSPGRSPTLR
jgi:uncharacterized protein YgbK (DUF1537 family)